jgi:hypothetical protein
MIRPSTEEIILFCWTGIFSKELKDNAPPYYCFIGTKEGKSKKDPTLPPYTEPKHDKGE